MNGEIKSPNGCGPEWMYKSKDNLLFGIESPSAYSKAIVIDVWYLLLSVLVVAAGHSGVGVVVGGIVYS